MVCFVLVGSTPPKNLNVFPLQLLTGIEFAHESGSARLQKPHAGHAVQSKKLLPPHPKLGCAQIIKLVAFLVFFCCASEFGF